MSLFLGVLLPPLAQMIVGKKWCLLAHLTLADLEVVTPLILTLEWVLPEHVLVIGEQLDRPGVRMYISTSSHQTWRGMWGMKWTSRYGRI